MKVGDNVFVYGTLRSSEANHHVIFGRAERLGEATFNQGVMYSLGPFPALELLSAPSDRLIHGEVFKVTDESLPRRLDYLEGYPSFYDRAEVEVILKSRSDGATPTVSDDKPTTAWVYYLKGRMIDEPIIKSGDWTNRHDMPHERGSR